MNPARWARLKQLFGEAIEREGGHRAGFVAEVRGADPELGDELASLVAAHERGAGALDAPPVPPPEPRTGRVGPYQLLRELGQGGMGTVHLAERVDDAYRKQVAIKVIRRGLDSSFLVSRFRNERQILASLVHPNIATLLDGGTTGDGLPYLVMEHVDGEPIDRFCEARALPVSRRLELFQQVCAAVEYAHRSLVIHRDLKPGNILVTREGVPKLLDFGVAKLLEPAGPEPAVDTVDFATPAFASPEQLRGAPVTTASDVYALGALLYLLLTGRRAFPDGGAGLEAIARAAAGDGPVRPSAVVDRRLRRLLAGDLDTIVLTAMHRDPRRRYASVERLAADVARHLSGRPIAAHPPSAGYRLGKFVSRHRLAVVAAGLVTIALAAGFVETARQRVRAERRFEDVRALARAFLFEFHDAIRDLPGSTLARGLVVRRAQEYLASLAREAGGDRGLQRELAEAYEQLAEVRGSWTTGLGDLQGAIGDLSAAVALREGLVRAAPDAAEPAFALAAALGRRGFARVTAGDRAGIEDGRRGLELARAAAAREGDGLRARRGLARAQQLLAKALIMADEHAAALVHIREVVGALEALAAAGLADAELERALAESAYFLGMALRAQPGSPPTAQERAEVEARLRRAVAINSGRVQASPGSTLARIDLSFSHVGLGQVLEELGRREEALASYRCALALREEVAAADPANAPARLYVAEARGAVASALRGLGRPADALEPLELAVRAVEALRASDPGNAYHPAFLAELRAGLEAAREEAERRTPRGQPRGL